MQWVAICDVLVNAVLSGVGHDLVLLVSLSGGVHIVLVSLSGVENLVLEDGQRVQGHAADLGGEGGVLFSHGVVGEVGERRVVEDWKLAEKLCGCWGCWVELGC
jgi:hypothetical protein